MFTKHANADPRIGVIASRVVYTIAIGGIGSDGPQSVGHAMMVAVIVCISRARVKIAVKSKKKNKFGLNGSRARARAETITHLFYCLYIYTCIYMFLNTAGSSNFTLQNNIINNNAEIEFYE